MKDRTRRGLMVAVTAAVMVAGVATVTTAASSSSTGQYSHDQLTGRAVLPAATFRPGSAPSGGYFSATDRANAVANGVTLQPAPAPAFANQPVQGFSAVIPAAGGDWWALTDNGYGARANSVDSELWVNRIKVDFGTGSNGSVSVVGGFGLSDPKGYIPWKIICDPTVGKALPDFDFNKFPATTPQLCGDKALRKLTGFDFDLESVQIAYDGTFWFGEEFGPFLLHTNIRGELLQHPVPLSGVMSPQNPTLDLTKGEQPTINGSKGFEGMSISPDRTVLYVATEGALASDDQRDLRINEYNIPAGKYTGRFWTVRLELRSTKVNLSTLKRGDGTPAYPGTVAPPSGLNAIGELTMINDHQAILIERDNGGDSPAVPRFKKLFLLDFDENDQGNYMPKTLLADLMAIPDPDNIAQAPAASYTGYFNFPFTTIESVFPLDDHSVLVADDNNFPFSNGRSFNAGGPLAADNDEFIRISFDTRFDLDRSVLTPPAARADDKVDKGGKGDDKKAPYAVALIGDYNYGCDLDVKVTAPATFAQGTTVPKCAGPLVDDKPAPTGIQIPGRQKSNNMIASINAAGVAFTVHDGDTKSGSTECRESVHDATKAQMNGLPINGAANPGYDKPIVYTPGDNEWTDCHRFVATPGIQKLNLDLIRSKYFSAPVSQGKTTMPLAQQPGYPENVRWKAGPVVYLTINQPGSNNNFCGALQSWPLFCNVDNEAVNRNAANVAWIKEGFRYAEDEEAQAVIVVGQGDPVFFTKQTDGSIVRVDTDPDYDINGYAEFLSTLANETKQFEGQVVFVHGDSHTATFDHPMLDASGKVLPNFTRIQTAGKEDTHWVKMTVNPRGPVLLSFELQVINANLGNVQNFSSATPGPSALVNTMAQPLPWNVKALPAKLDLPRFEG